MMFQPGPFPCVGTWGMQFSPHLQCAGDPDQAPPDSQGLLAHQEDGQTSGRAPDLAQQDLLGGDEAAGICQHQGPGDPPRRGGSQTEEPFEK